MKEKYAEKSVLFIRGKSLHKGGAPTKRDSDLTQGVNAIC